MNGGSAPRLTRQGEFRPRYATPGWSLGPVGGTEAAARIGLCLIAPQFKVPPLGLRAATSAVGGLANHRHEEWGS